MNLLSLFSVIAVAQELIISPLPSSGAVVQPQQSFKMITQAQNVLGAVATNSGLVVLSDPPTPLIPPTDTSIIGTTTPPPLPTPTTYNIQPTTIPTPLPTRIPTPTSAIKHPGASYRSLKIAFLGDSMIDTLGPGFPALADVLKEQYPHIAAIILNYGVGATNIEYGITRITNDYVYLGNNIPSLVSQHPDIVVLESFAYNPFPDADGGLNRHWLDLAKAVQTLRTNLPNAKIIIAATIAPSKKLFGDGAPMIAFSQDEKYRRTDQINQYLKSTLQFAKGEQLPYIDAYTPSLTAGGDGTVSLINPGDHIHYSDAGRHFFAEKTLQTLESLHLLE